MLKMGLASIRRPIFASTGMPNFSSTPSTSNGEKKIADLLRKRFPNAKEIKVEDISGGCGSMYRVAVETADFAGKAKVQQHKMVTETLKAEISNMHGITIETRVPKS